MKTMLTTCFGTLALLVLTTMTDAHNRQRPAPAPFEFATLIVEQNATDGDTEVVLEGKAGDEGLQLLYIESPDRRNVVTLIAPDRTTLGMREFRFESPEPPGTAVLAAYPEGTYTVYGVSTTGERFLSRARLSHQLPGETTILSPADDAVVPVGPVTLRWSAVPGIQQYILEFENESVDPQQVLTLNLPADTTEFEVPASLIVPGASYQVGVRTIAVNGNVVAIESGFTTED